MTSPRDFYFSSPGGGGEAKLRLLQGPTASHPPVLHHHFHPRTSPSAITFSLPRPKIMERKGRKGREAKRRIHPIRRERDKAATRQRFWRPGWGLIDADTQRGRPAGGGAGSPSLRPRSTRSQPYQGPAWRGDDAMSWRPRSFSSWVCSGVFRAGSRSFFSSCVRLCKASRPRSGEEDKDTEAAIRAVQPVVVVGLGVASAARQPMEDDERGEMRLRGVVGPWRPAGGHGCWRRDPVPLLACA